MITAAELDSEIARKRWTAYPLLVKALKDAMDAFCADPVKDLAGERFKAIDRGAQLLILLGEQKQLVPSCCAVRPAAADGIAK